MNLEEELKQCRKFAESGYQLASNNYAGIKDTLIDVARKIDNADNAQNKMYRIENTELLNRQKHDLKKLAAYINKIHDDIEMLHDRQKDFTLIVYGRTMAGKSTLMEILTHGDGKSIGKGAQRTTLDVRAYYWNGLKIFDVPGICAFGGAEDDKLAFEAAKSADLILFLLTDDAPQPDEALALAQLKNLGKPVLGIVNVKMAFDSSRKKLSLRNLQKKLADTERLDTICAQFKNFAKIHNQNWSDIKFVYTHLNAAYQAYKVDDPEIYSASNFAQVKDFIIDKVQRDGKFLRMKNFIDIVAVPMQKIISEIYKRSSENFRESNLYIDKIRQFASWRQIFIDRSNQRLNRFYSELKSQIDNAIEDFTNKNYSNENAGKDWQNVIAQMNLQGRCQNILEELANECESKRRSLSDQLTQEMKFNFSGNAATSMIKMDGTTPWGKIAFQVAAGALLFVPGVGWAARIGIGIGGALLGNLFDNKEDKIRENKNKLRKALQDGTYPMLDNLREKVLESFNNEIVAKGIDDFGETLNSMSKLLAKLGAAQTEVANNLMKNYFEINLELLQNAVEYSRSSGFLSSVDYLARLPGKEFFIVASRSSIDNKKITELLGENFSVIKNAELHEIISVILGCGYIKNKFAIIPSNSVADTNFELAQQIAGMPIIK